MRLSLLLDWKDTRYPMQKKKSFRLKVGLIFIIETEVNY